MKYNKYPHIPTAAYCSPSPAGGEYPSKIVPESYRLLKECGVDILFGHNEIFGSSEECNREVFRAMDYCAEYGIDYLVNDRIIHEFTAVENSPTSRYKPFSQLTDDEKEDLKQRYLASLAIYICHPA